MNTNAATNTTDLSSKTTIDVYPDYDDVMYADRTLRLRIPSQLKLDDRIRAVRELERGIRGDISKLPDATKDLSISTRSLHLQGVHVDIGPDVNAELASLGLSFAASYLESAAIRDKRDNWIIVAGPFEVGLLESHDLPDAYVEAGKVAPSGAQIVEGGFAT